jgi:radical SAM superfamily enzyme YgiQ (UPF0313 family)
MKIRLVCLEDGITSCGFRKIAAYAERIHPGTRSCYVSTTNYRSIRTAIRGNLGGAGELTSNCVDEITEALAGSDVVGLSSMTGYAGLTRAVISRLREVAPRTFIIWGGIHPIVHPEDAISAEVDAICTGEGELAFEEFIGSYAEGRDFTSTRNFWFKRGGEIQRNGFRPLMTPEEMEELPFPKYGDGEWIYRKGKGFEPLELGDFLATNGLGYTAIWSIGCPFHCAFCGNTRFIANDPKYKKVRHPSPRYVVEEVKAVRSRFPHISSVSFHDDSFMAIPFRELERFATLWRAEVGIPFAVYGVIPNYVRQDKLEVLTWAGMNRIRMGIQSGSDRILDFYRRPTPVEKVEAGANAIASFAPRYHIPPSYDVIMDNPIETRQDVIDTLELLYRIARPFTLFIFSLRVIPNTELERLMKERGVDIETISSNYSTIPARWANILLYLITLWRPPRWLWDRMLRRVEASGTPQKTYPLLGGVMRTLYLAKRVWSHLRFMDFSIVPGYTGYVFWRLGIVRFWWKYLTPRPERPSKRPDVPVILSVDGQEVG